MQPRWITLLWLSILVVWFTSPARAESYARVCATTVDAESNEAPLAETSAPGAGEKLVVQLRNTFKCLAGLLCLFELLVWNVHGFLFSSSAPSAAFYGDTHNFVVMRVSRD